MKLGIVMEGGASRTVFSCGVADALLEENILPNYFVGVSAGIAFGISYLSQQKGRNLVLAQKFMPSRKYMGARYLLNPRIHSYYNLPYVYGEVPDKLLPFDYDAFAKFAGQVEAVVTNARTGKAEYIDLPRDKSMMPWLVASCAMPVMFRPVPMNGQLYYDGGVADSVPYKRARECGCDKTIVILTRERSYVKKQEHGSRIINKMCGKFPAIVEDLKTRPARYNACTQALDAAEQRGEAFVLAPENTFGVSRTEADPQKLTMLYEEGYRVAKSHMAALKVYLAK